MGYPQEVRGSGDRSRVFDHEGQELTVDLIVEGVNLVIVVADLSACLAACCMLWVTMTIETSLTSSFIIPSFPHTTPVIPAHHARHSRVGGNLGRCGREGESAGMTGGGRDDVGRVAGMTWEIPAYAGMTAGGRDDGGCVAGMTWEIPAYAGMTAGGRNDVGALRE